jgi:hypothetical protein
MYKDAVRLALGEDLDLAKTVAGGSLGGAGGDDDGATQVGLGPGGGCPHHTLLITPSPSRPPPEPCPWSLQPIYHLNALSPYHCATEKQSSMCLSS